MSKKNSMLTNNTSSALFHKNLIKTKKRGPLSRFFFGGILNPSTNFDRALTDTLYGTISRPKIHKKEALKYWSDLEQKGLRENSFPTAFGSFLMKKFASVHAESKSGVILDYFSLGSGKLSITILKAIGKLSILSHAKTMVQLGKALDPMRKTAGISRPLASKSQRALAVAEKVISKKIPNLLKIYTSPLTIQGYQLATPRRALSLAGNLKTASKIKLKSGNDTPSNTDNAKTSAGQKNQSVLSTPLNNSKHTPSLKPTKYLISRPPLQPLGTIFRDKFLPNQPLPGASIDNILNTPQMNQARNFIPTLPPYRPQFLPSINGAHHQLTKHKISKPKIPLDWTSKAIPPISPKETFTPTGTNLSSSSQKNHFSRPLPLMGKHWNTGNSKSHSTRPPINAIFSAPPLIPSSPNPLRQFARGL